MTFNIIMLCSDNCNAELSAALEGRLFKSHAGLSVLHYLSQPREEKNRCQRLAWSKV